MKQKVYQYRIIKLKNGLSQVRYIAECKLEISFWDKLKRKKERWERIMSVIMIPPFSKDATNKEKLDYAYSEIQEHKQRNIHTEEIILID